MEAATAAASSKNEDKNSPSPAPPRARAVIVCVVSLLFTLFAARALRRSSGADEDQLVSTVVWALSPPICAYLFFWAVALSGPTVAGALSLLARVTFLPLLADAATNLVASPCAGAAAMFLATVYSAVMVGRAVSFRWQRAGTEQTAITAAATSAPSYRSRAEDKHDRSGCGVVVGMPFVAGMPFAIMSLVALSSEPDAEIGGDAALGVFMLGAGPFLLVMRHLQLEGKGSPLQTDTEDFVWSMVSAVIGCVVVAGVAGVHVGAAAAVVVVWAGALAMARFFGYGRALEAQYERLAAIKRSEPRTAQDASGLLVGRDEEDVRLLSSYRRGRQSLPGLCLAETDEVQLWNRTPQML
ncbi:unnamed protein product [Urochloa decumbens]|uniref:Uncharacterized protein n=1 Tax=Urochloa decumbens TaxID=240449 RepID=A0ABC9B5N1_9POAL